MMCALHKLFVLLQNLPLLHGSKNIDNLNGIYVVLYLLPLLKKLQEQESKKNDKILLSLHGIKVNRYRKSDPTSQLYVALCKYSNPQCL